ncbi:AMP-binding protein [bacterium]|jgi:carnitine-CoA ligase|nr:AMP-binding protein [bacterium]MBT3850261.1 AMP-binding protein [bacterium]MDG2446001.1 AMP-binding protein [Thermodesulfobacteriota bacterium]|tara:strand:- start:2973 stop:4667 length:1695 start_codon:yes stop_codon:yes gene_type:complete
MSKKKYPIKDLNYPTHYSWKRKFDFDWNTKSDQRNWTLPKVLKDQADSIPDKDFLQFSYEKALTFSQVNKQANKIADSLKKLGINKTDKVSVYMPNSLEICLAWFGILKNGSVMVPINTAYVMDFLQYIIESSDSKIIIIAEEYLERLANIQDRIPKIEKVIVWTRDKKDGFESNGYNKTEAVSWNKFLSDGSEVEPSVEVTHLDHARLMYTSGTTGKSKGVVRPCAADYSSAQNYSSIMDLTNDDTVFTCLPLFHSNAMVMGVYPAMISGCKVVVEEKYSASKFWKWMKDFEITKFNLVGVMSYFMWNAPVVPEEKEHKVKLVLGSPAPHDIIEEFMERFNILFTEGYGLTEVGQCTFTRPNEPFRVGSCGKESPGYEIKIVNPETDEELPRNTPGELVLRPRIPNICLHYYYKMPEKTVSDFRNLWFHTGDLCRMDEDGYIFFMDRVKDYIRRRGENISSFEVENLISTHSNIEESAAIAVKLDEQGRHSEDELMIVIVLKEGLTLMPEELIEYLKPIMPKFMIPRFVRFRDSLPKTPTNRVQKVKLREEGITKDTWDSLKQ